MIEVLCEAISQNKQFYKMMEVLIDFTLKLLTKYSHVREFFTNKKMKYLNFIVRWIEKNETPPIPQRGA